jgi:benzoyl-CoA reductase/2-hydroxyglutaryl-CoA dehydratase subunit BcrC/BadD/HgdB
MTSSRQQYLCSQKAAGRRVLGVFPALHPRELAWALNILPVEIWDPPLAEAQAHSHLQPYICSVVHQGLELILSGQADLCDAFLFPHTCDSIQNLASVVHDYIGQNRACHFLYHPKPSLRESSRAYYQAELKRLAGELAGEAGRPDPERLAWAVAQGQEITRLTAELYAARAAGGLALPAAEFYRVLRRGEWLWPEEHAAELRELLASGRNAADDPRRRSGPRVVLSGILPNPSELLKLLDGLGAAVAHDDLLCCGRRLLFAPSDAADLWEVLTQQYLSLPPCSTRGDAIAARRERLLALAREGGARGVILLMVKFCEPELFDAPILADNLKAAGLNVLSLEVELNRGLSGQMSTRVEAFLEMLG